MVTQFTTHVLCLLETNVGGFYHATSSALSPLDRLQDSFLREIGLMREQGFTIYNMAPLATRRDIAMLGLIFRCATGRAHVGLQALFPVAPPVGHTHSTRAVHRRHNKQLLEEGVGTHHALIQRSVFGLLRVWNRLPADVVEKPSVSSFQTAVTGIVKDECRARTPDWSRILSPTRFLL